MIELTQLENGLRIVTGSLPGVHSVAIGVWVGVGGRHETPHTSGASHFLEHLLFKGTKRRSYKRIKEDIEGVGGSFNGFTAEECTCYFVRVLSEHMETGIDVLCDMVRNALLRPEDIERERTVILEEIKMYLDMPSQYVHEVLTQTLWPNHPLGMNLAGTKESVVALQRKTIAAHKEAHYHPRNIVISICGNVDHVAAVEAVRKRMKMESRRRASRFKKVREAQQAPRAAFITQKTEQSHLALGFHSFSRKDPRRFALDLVNIVTGANMSSRLFNEVREKQGLAYEIRSQTTRYSDTGAFVVSAGCEPSKTTRTLEVVLRELNLLKRKPVGRGELDRAKEYSVGQFKLALEDTTDHMLWLGQKVITTGALPDSKEILMKIRKLRAGDLMQAARTIFRGRNLNLALVSPLAKKETSRIQRVLNTLR